MVDRTTLTTIADGDKLFEGYFNGNLQRVKKFTFVNTPEETSVADNAWHTVASGTLIVDFPDDHIILGYKLEGDLKSASGGSASCRALFAGGATYTLLTTTSTSFVTLVSNKIIDNSLNSSSYSITLELKGDLGSGAIPTVKNVTITVYVLQGAWDTEEQAFS